MRLTGVVSHGHSNGTEPIGTGRGTPETEPDVHRPCKRSATTRTVVRTQHASVAQPDRQVHGRAEPHAVPAEISASRVQKRAVLV